MELNEFLQPLNAPVTQSSQQVTGYDFLSNNERGAFISQGLFGTAVIGEFNVKDAAITNAKIVDLDADKILAGTVTVSLGIGGANVTIDGANNRIIVNDGTNDRVIIGKDTGGF
jgi:hypothetical protein